MFCTKCGTQLEEGANFCPKCGAPVAAAVTATAAPPAAVGPRTSGMATASLVCGIAGFIFGPILSILAIIFGGVALSHTGKDPGLKGRDMAIVGLVLGIVTGIGWIFFVIWIISIIWGIFVI
jgi:hypothetical protein